ncbi:ORF88 [Ranid herpesvirus 1]|uniref:ORF88 n=1 Tax=Ranid herpesvirus 1 TaxID=85655 RepID=Q9YQX9_9VIRU|nr:ORF88 [Ranid herpesvirus 1]AAD12286.1 ORF88 [Ranid herpesvirus 1]
MAEADLGSHPEYLFSTGLAHEYQCLARARIALLGNPGAAVLEPPNGFIYDSGQASTESSALALYCVLLRDALQSACDDAERNVVRTGLVSLLDYDTRMADVLCYYCARPATDTLRILSELRSFWVYALRTPLVPPHIDDLRTCFFCLSDDRRVKNIAMFCARVRANICVHYHAPVVELASRPLGSHPAVHRGNEAPVLPSVFVSDAAVLTWQSENDEAALEARVHNDDERRAALVAHRDTALRERLTSGRGTDVLRVVRQRTRQLKMERRANELARNIKVCGEALEAFHSPRYFTPTPFFVLHMMNRRAAHAARVQEELCGAALPPTAGRCVAKLKDMLRTADVTHLRAEIVNAFYLFAFPPPFVYRAQRAAVAPRYSFVDLLFGAGVNSASIAALRNFLREADLAAYRGVACPAPHDPYTVLLWSVVNIFSYFVLFNRGERTWRRSDDVAFHTLAEGFVHLPGCGWGILYVRPGATPRVWLASPQNLYACLADHLVLVEMHGGGFGKPSKGGIHGGSTAIVCARGEEGHHYDD